MTGFLQVFAMLAVGLVLGLFARLVLPGKHDVSWSETIVVGMLGAGVGGVAVNLIRQPDEPITFGLPTFIAAVAGSMLVLAGLIFFKRRRVDHVTLPVAELIAAGESESVEFKQTARHNSHTGQKDARLELVIAKTVAGFMNGEGGTLLIGVADDGTVVGIKPDLQHLKQPDLDRFELWLTDLLETCLGTSAITDVDVSFEPIEGETVVRVDVPAATRPIFLDPPGGGREADFYVRVGNSTRKLLTDEVLQYQKTRWG